MRVRTDADMTKGSVWRHLLSFSVPMAIGLLFQQLYNTVDTVVVGQFVGKEAQAAVGSTGSIINTIVGFCAGLATGASVVISQHYGAHDQKELSLAVHTSICLTFIISVISTVLGILIIDPMLRFMRTPENVMDEAHSYLMIYFSGVIGVLFYNMGSGILRAVGDSRRPLMFLMMSALLNTALDLLFVLRFNMGVEGVAYATVLSQIISAALIIVTLMREHSAYGIRLRLLRIDMSNLRSILRIGLPSSIQAAVTSFSNVFVQSYINFFGDACMAGYGIYNKVDSFALIPVQAIGMSSTTFVGQNWGARNIRRANRGVRSALIMSLATTVVMGTAIILLSRQLLGFFSPEEDVVAYGQRFVRIVTPFYLMLCFTQIIPGALRGIGDASVPTLIMLFSFVIFRQIYLAVTSWLGLGFIAVALAYPIGWIVCTVLLIIRYKTSPLSRKEPVHV